MFPFSNNGDDLISYSDQQTYNRPFFNGNFISNFPSPFFPYELEIEACEVFPQQSVDLLLHRREPLRATCSATLSHTAVNVVDTNQDDAVEITKICNSDQKIPRKRCRDRHSKIYTAQGPRDRRMRLSLKVAREFFDLQDKLCFDKASKTVEWLLMHARNEIKKLSSAFPHVNYNFSVGPKSAPSTFECEVLPKFSEANSMEGSISAKAKPSPCVKKDRKTSKRKSRKTTFHPLAKESREKARARARERTREKWSRRIIEGSKHCEESSNQSHDRINPSLDALAELVQVAPSYQEEEQLGNPTEVLIDESLDLMGIWSPSFSNYLNNPGIPQEDQFTDFQSLSAYNIN